MRVAIYARVSTHKQATTGHSLDGQVSRLREYASQNGMTVVGDPIVEAESGGWRDRPGVARVRQLAEAGDIDALLATKSDRVARNVRDLLNLAHDLQELGVDLVLADDQFDTSTPMGKAMFTVRATFAELEREMTRERIREGIAAARAKGVRVGRPPAGYAADPDQRGRLVVADPRAVAQRDKLRQTVRRYRRQGMSLRQIAARLEERGIPTITGRTKWNPNSVRALLG